MERLTIALDDEQMRLLRAFAERRGQTPEEAVVALLSTVYPPQNQPLLVALQP